MTARAGGTAADAGAASPRPQRRARASTALGWSFLNTAVSKLGTLAIGVALARLLGPEAFGTYAVAYVALVAVLSFNELGVSLAIVRWPVDPRTIAPTVATISVVSSGVVALAVYVAAPAFATAMGDPEATTPVRILGLSVIVNGLVAVPAALLQRAFQQGRRMVADQVNVWLGAIVSVILALAGAGAMALVIGRLAGALVSGVLLVALAPGPYRFGYDRQVVRPLLAFGLPLAGASLIVFAAGYVDQVVVGTTLGAVALGYYVLAFNLSSWPVAMFSQPVRNVAPALFARLQQEPEQMRASLVHFLRPLAAVALPVCVALAVAAEPVVGLVYGQEWLPAAAPLRWLAVLAALRIIFELSYDFLVVEGRSRALLGVQTFWFVVLLPAVMAGAGAAGLSGVGAAQVAVAAGVVAPVYLLLLRRSGVTPRALGGALLAPVMSSGALAAALLGLGSILDSPFLTLAVAVLLGLAAAGPVLWRTRADLHVFRSTSLEEDR